jgi:hypothetical protein
VTPRVPTAIGVAISALVVLAAADVVGVIVSFVLDIAPVRHKSSALGYAIWFVLGAFAGVIHYGAAAGGGLDGWKSLAEARSAGVVILGTTGAVLTGLVALFYVTMWRHGSVFEWAVVPDHLATTAVFLVAFLLATLVAHHASTPAAPGGSS